MTKNLVLAYLAGIVDGEGYIGIKRSRPTRDRVSPTYHARIQVRMVDEPAIALLADTLGGNYYQERAHSHKGRPLFCWQASDRLAAEIVTTLRPYLRVKARQADNLLALRAVQAEVRRHQTVVTGYRFLDNGRGAPKRVSTRKLSDEYLARVHCLYLHASELNS